VWGLVKVRVRKKVKKLLHILELINDHMKVKFQVTTIKDDLEMIGEKVWERFNHGKLQQHWYYTSIVKELSPRKKECKLILELEKRVKEVFGSLKVLTETFQDE
jgi:superoxide dismutase